MHLQSELRGLQIFDIFNKEKAAERRKALQDEMRRGYFDDFTDLKETGGRMFPAAEGLAPAATAPTFPAFTALRPDGSEEAMPPVTDAAAAVLVSVAFRAGAEDMLSSWSGPFSSAFGSRPNARWLELSFVESTVMCLWPFREPLFHFGDATTQRQALDMTNRLTGYAYLLDSRGCVRWRASGKARGAEAGVLLQAAEQLLNQA
ncbi:hypothetical protein WJX81_006027 [Elliptochloris bilobata]|uniref:Uncharacterized protein n=1 Tax=Elliptochloris bilobata TaxID=381761 RepID=A0AAW1RD00_9CHLO